MFSPITERFGSREFSFNMTPLIDIVFLLIIFFVIVFQFIGAEGVRVDLPQDCGFARSGDEGQLAPAAITVRKTDEGQISFAVGAEQADAGDRKELARTLAGSLDRRLKNLPQQQRVVVLRIDKDVTCAEAQYALAAAAGSCALRLRLATLAEPNQVGR
jgi:biopolymer transport protein ExbD